MPPPSPPNSLPPPPLLLPTRRSPPLRRPLQITLLLLPFLQFLLLPFQFLLPLPHQLPHPLLPLRRRPLPPGLLRRLPPPAPPPPRLQRPPRGPPRRRPPRPLPPPLRPPLPPPPLPPPRRPLLQHRHPRLRPLAPPPLSLRLFRRMSQVSAPDLCTYNSLLRALCINGRVRDAAEVFDEMRRSGPDPDAFTYRALVPALCRAFRVDDALRIFREMDRGVRPDTVVYNALLDGLLKVRRLDDACRLFEQMAADGVRASCCSHNILIHGLFRNGRPAAAFALFCDLKSKRGQFVDAVTYSIVIAQLCREKRAAEALDLAREMEERGLAIDLVTITSLLVGLHRSGRWELAEQLMKYVRDSSVLPSVLSWKANMEAAMRGPHDRGKDYTPMFPEFEGNLNDVVSLIGRKSCEDIEEEALSDEETKDEWSSSLTSTV
uniref:Pentatricopeptide repeat-containing protein n=1 Tax=Ananas comosus var. bracteatus TaxID=296719 RepID=A0A6V7PPX7_ANACO|nr:unnamed protein product [Ananas comosus var. bracteatus]